ncbi:MAG TPA: lycopene cyclase family protein [Polyangiales bacterium]|nr:lycopene cyclase family protein [Polyangiales bacterium]
MTRTHDIAVLGSGPAAASIAAAASRRGASVALIAPAPRGPWKPNYCLWADEIPAGMEHLAERVWDVAEVATRLGQRTLDRRYAKLDNGALQAFLWDELERGSTRVISERAAELEYRDGATWVHTESGAVEQALVVIDASGAGTGFVRRVHQRTPAYQIAYGLLLHAPGHGFDPSRMVMMDFRPASDDDTDPPSFLYVLPLSEDRLFVEETSLARRPAVSMDLLRARLRKRLVTHGLQAAERLDEERCAIPMGLGLPARGQWVVPFGAAAAMMHPASGYHVFHVLRKAEPVARAILDALDTGNVDDAVAAGNAAVWPRSHRKLWELYGFGLETLVRMNADEISRFFDAFFELPRDSWSGYLGATLEPGALGTAMTQIFRTLPASVQWHLIRRGFSAGAAPLARTFFQPRTP